MSSRIFSKHAPVTFGTGHNTKHFHEAVKRINSPDPTMERLFDLKERIPLDDRHRNTTLQEEHMSSIRWALGAFFLIVIVPALAFVVQMWPVISAYLHG